MTQFQDAPPAEAPKSANSFISFDALPKGGAQVMTLVATNFIPEYEFEDLKTHEKWKAPAIELFYGTIIDHKSYFVKTWPKAYSINPKSTYSKAVKAMTDELPESGSSPKDFLGKSALLTIENSDKVSTKGTKYTVSKIAGFSPVPDVLKAHAPSFDQLKVDFDAILKKKAEGNDGADKDVPF